MSKSIKKKVVEKKKEDKASDVIQKENLKSQWEPNRLTITVTVVLVVLFLVLLSIFPYGYYRQLSRASTEVTAEETTVVEEIDKLTYEEFKERFEELVKKVDTMSPEEFQKEAKELLMKSSIEDLSRANDYLEGRVAEMETTTDDFSVTQTTSENKETVVLESATIDWNTPWYRSPWPGSNELLDDQLKDELTWETLAEPGVLPGIDNTQTAWDKMGTKETFILIPEAGYTFMANGGCSIYLIDPSDGTETLLGYFPPAKERIYLFIIRGLPSDGGDLDLNRTILVKDYVPGTSINHVLRAGSYVSLGWFLQQIEASWEPTEGLEDPNVGANGAENVYPTFLDVETQAIRAWKVIGPTIRDWERVNDL
ncbi:hypothetical protein MUP35_01305 [Patescibacteria group bacterium]|nr:hypothetical protein [Patescibacteria group bacterium]